MVDKIVVTGMVMLSSPVNDYDRRCVILTTELGRISAFARVARRQGNRLMGVTESFIFGEFTLLRGRESYSLINVDVKNYFSGIRSDLGLVALGSYLMEFASYYTRENVNEKATLGLLYQTLRIMEKGTVPLRLIRRIFELKLMTIHGEGPQVFECLHCRTKEGLTHFSVRRGGVLCDKCGSDANDRINISEALLYTMQFIASTPVERIYTFNLSGRILEELAALMDRYIKRYIDRNFKSTEMLEILITE